MSSLSLFSNFFLTIIPACPEQSLGRMFGFGIALVVVLLIFFKLSTSKIFKLDCLSTILSFIQSK